VSTPLKRLDNSLTEALFSKVAAFDQLDAGIATTAAIPIRSERKD
jgi:hypothetical protein